jgi:hypothetical protein
MPGGRNDLADQEHISIRVRLPRSRNRSRTVSSPQTDQEERNETQSFLSDSGLGFIVWQRGEFERSGKACADAYRRLPLRQLSVQHSEGREPSRLRTKT